ncbi:hypothetical protein JCM3774_003701 [Rhodotorula dairenensis]
MIDSLIQFLLEEVAMDGDAGTSIEALAEFIHQFYARAGSASSTGDPHPLASTSTAGAPVAAGSNARTQKVDDAFITFVWNALIDLPDVRIGVFSKLESHDTSAAKENAVQKTDPAKRDEDALMEAADQTGDGDDTAPEASGSGKRKKKKIERKLEGPTHEMRILPAAERELGREALMEKYGDRLRVLSGEETTWVAITGSHLRPSSLTPTIYSVLQMISRSREEGTTAVRISKELGIDPKSVFHYLKVPQQLGIIKKFRDTDEGRWTNRALHVRYLATSPIWAVHVSTEPDAVKEEEGGGGDDDGAAGEEEAGAGAQWGGDEMSPISPLYLTTNHEVIRGRIVKALKRRKDWWMPHHDLHTAIGLHAATSNILRRLNSIVSTMADEGILEKVSVTKRKSGSVQTRIQAIRLRRPDELKTDEDVKVDTKSRTDAIREVEGDGDDDGSSYPATMRTIEQQVLDLLMNAGSRGITNLEISSALGNFSMRFIESISQRLGRSTLPAHLGDYTIYSLQETVGRLKQTRWFSLVGYLSYRRARSFPDERQEERWKAIEEQGRLGQWDEEADDGPREGQYGTALERQKRLNKFKMWAHAGDDNSTIAGRKGTKKAANPGGKGKGKGKAAAGVAATADDAGTVSDGNGPFNPLPAKPKGRPRKNPLKEGEESTYMRKKREKAEDEERARLGLPPLVRPARPRGKSAKKAAAPDPSLVIEGDTGAESITSKSASAAAVETSTDAASVEKSPAKKKSKKKAAGAVATTPEAVGEEIDELAEETPPATAPPPPAKKKRGRPPKIKPSETLNSETTSSAPTVATMGVPATTASVPSAAAASSGDRANLPSEDLFAPGPSAAAAVEPEAKQAEVVSPSKVMPASPSKVVASSPSRLKRTILTMEPWIEIDVTPPLKRSKKVSTAATRPTPTAVRNTPTEPSTSVPVAATMSAAVAGPSGTQGGRLETVASPQTPVPVTSAIKSTPLATSSPAPDTSSPQASIDVDKIRVSSATTESKPKKKSHSSRPSIVSKLNLTQLSRQKEVLDYVAASGGIIERTHRLNELIHAWSALQTPPVSLYRMDKQVVNEVLNVAVRGGRLKRTVVTGAKGERYEVYYLPTIDLASEEARRFFANLSESIRPNRFQMFRAVAEITDESGDEEARDAIGTGKKRLHDQQALDDPEPANGKAAVQEYFRQQQAVLGRVHGVKYGLIARARQLHKWLASYVYRHADEPDSGISRDNSDLVIAQQVLLDRMPLGVYRRIVPLPIESEQLDAYLDHEANQHTAMRDLPDEIACIIRPRLGKRKAAMWRILELLMDLSLLSPAVRRVNERGTEVFARPRAAKHASDWRFHVRAPLYSFADARAPLVALHALHSNQDVSAFWTALQSVSTAKHLEPLPGTQAEGFPSLYSGRNLSRRELVSVARWRDTYQLVPTQRSFLCKLAVSDPSILDETRTAELAEWAASLYAPVDVVTRYLSDVIGGRPGRAANGKRRHVRKVVTGADGAETELLVSEGEETRETATAILARKRKDAAAQQEQDWNGILERFRHDHHDPELDQIIVDWLHGKFIDPRPSNKLDAKQLDFELRRVLPPDNEAHPGPAEDRQSLVPLAVQRKARRAKDPYAVTREPDIRKRTERAGKARVPRVRPGRPKKLVAPRQRELSPFVPDLGEDADAPFQPADQRAFLENPLPPYPKLGPGKRISRSHFGTEHDELLLDAEIVLQVRAQALNLRVQFGALEWFFPGNSGGVLSKRVRTLLKRPADKDMHDRVTNAFTEVYNTYKGSVRDPNPRSLVNFDLAAWIRLLREKVNRRQLRLMAAPEVKQTQNAIDLPGSLSELRQYYHLKPADGATPLDARWDKAWAKYHISAAIRDDAVASAPFAQTWEEKAPFLSDTREYELALGALKTVLSTPDETYREAEGDIMLKPFAASIDRVVEDLTEKGHIISAERDPARRIPGRNFSFTDKYLNRFGGRIDLSHMQEASRCEQDLLSSPDATFPLAPVPGEMMAFFDLISEGKVSLSIDTSTLTEKALDVRDYGTRQANDDDIECTVNMQPVSSVPSRRSKTVLPEPVLDLAKLGTNTELEAATYDLLSEDSLPSALLKILTAAGKDGVPYTELLDRFEKAKRAGSQDFVNAVARLTASSRPLAFFAGSTAVSLVSIRHLADWTVPVPASQLPEEAEEPAPAEKRFLPTIWTTVRGQVNSELYHRAVGWIKGELKARSGVTTAYLVDRAVGSHLLSAYEVYILLVTLLKAGMVACREDPIDGEVDAAGKTARTGDEDENRINWARCHWFAEGVFW